MRIKESAHDYRYFPDPDLLPVRTAKIVEAAKDGMPELPQAKRERFVSQYEVSAYDAAVLADDKALADYFEEAAKGSPKPKSVANWIINDLLSALSAASLDLSACPIRPAAIGELTALIEGDTISGRQGKEVFAAMMESGKSPAVIVEVKGLKQVSEHRGHRGFLRRGDRRQPEFRRRLQVRQGGRAELPQGPGHEALQGEGQSCRRRRDPRQEALLGPTMDLRGVREWLVRTTPKQCLLALEMTLLTLAVLLLLECSPTATEARDRRSSEQFGAALERAGIRSQPLPSR